MKKINSLLIKQKAIELGFDACGIAQIKTLSDDGEHLKSWLDKGFQGDMTYIERGFEKRIDPTKIVSNAKSIIVLLTNYFPQQTQSNNTLQIAKYAYGTDYHTVLKHKIVQLELFLKEKYPNATTKGYTDTGSVLEKKWAVEAGLGWIGKQTLFISPTFGTYCLIAEIITDLELEYDVPYTKNHCGTCTACIQACPTQAIAKPRVLNATKCISYLTIESKREIPPELKNKFNGRIFGCDICQDICPYNTQVTPNTSNEFQLSPSLLSMTRENWNALDEETFNTLFKDSAVTRTGFSGFQRNIALTKLR